MTKTWKLWSLGAVVSLGMACSESGGVTIEECGPDQERTEEGLCQDKTPVVVVEEPECSADEECPDAGWKCEGEVCVDKAPCRIAAKACTPGLICVADSAFPAKGEAGKCEIDSIGKPCRAGEDNDCIAQQVCEPQSSGAGHVCQHGERDADGKAVPVLSEFELSVNGGTPVSPNAWVSTAAAELSVRARGPGANADLKVKTPAGDLDTTTECTQNAECSAEDCKWTCSLPANWTGLDTTKNVELLVSIASGTEKVWAYRLSLPSISAILAPAFAVLGQELEVCVTATVTSPSIALADIRAPMLEVVLPGKPNEVLPLTWTPGTLTGGKKCWTTTLPPTLPGPGTLNDAWMLEVSAEAEDAAEQVAKDDYSEPLVLTGISCEVAPFATADSVNAPLAFSNDRLVFGARLSGVERLYFFDTVSCASAGSLNTGVVQGPMVVLGDTHQIALALGDGGPVAGQRLSVVDVATQGFVADSHCVPGDVTSAANATFGKGLSLLSIGDGTTKWQLAVPTNADADTVLTAYTPVEAAPADRCIASAVIGASVALTPVQTDQPGTIVAHGDELSAWSFDENGWAQTPWSFSNVSTAGLLGIALDAFDSLWLSASAAPRLQLCQSGEDRPTVLLGAGTQNTSAVAIDDQGRAYVMGLHGAGSGSVYRLHRLSADGEVEASFDFEEGTGNAAGSPILGQPLSGNAADAEVYIVSRGTTAGANSGKGKVFAFNVNDLTKPLWKIELEFAVSGTAQPVLVPHANGGGTLWVVGMRGEVRGIRVVSEGLSQTASWPKAFRDNCNTSNALVTPDNMPACF